MHYLHTSGLGGGFLPLNLPPSDGAPKPIATAIDAYMALRAERLSLTRERAALAGRQPERLAEEQDARLAAESKPPKYRKALDDKRAALSHQVKGLEVRLDDVLLTLIDAVNTHGPEWLAALESVKADAAARTTAALQVVEDQGTRVVEANRLMTWCIEMPTRCKWSGDLQPIPDDMATPISTLQRYMNGEITADNLGISKLGIEAA